MQHLSLALAVVWLVAVAVLHAVGTDNWLMIAFCWFMAGYNLLRWLVTFVVPWLRRRPTVRTDEARPVPKVVDPTFDFSRKPEEPPSST